MKPSATPPQPRAPLVLAVVATLLYAPLIGWGLPHATAPDRIKTYAADELLPLEPLAEMHSTLIASQPDRNYNYPWWHYCVLAAAQAPYLGLLWIAGDLTAPSPEYPFGLSDPVRALQILTLIGRLVSVLMAAAIVAAACSFGRDVWDEQTGIAGAVLTMLSFPMLYYSGTGNLDVPAAFWTGLGLAVFARTARRGVTPGRAAWLGVLAGFAMATKDQSVLVFLPLGVAMLVPRLVGGPDPEAHRRCAAIALGAALAAYAIGTGLWIDPHRHLAHLERLLSGPTAVSTAYAYFEPHPATWAGLAGLARDALASAADAFSIPVLLAFAAGVLRSRGGAVPRGVLLAPLVLLVGLLFVPGGFAPMRYYLPLVPVVAGFAAHGILGLRQTRLRALSAPALALVCVYQVWLGLDLRWAQLRETRAAAGRWIAAHVRPGERLEYFGSPQKLPPLPAGVESRGVAGRGRWPGAVGHESAILEYLRADGPAYLVLIPDWSSSPDADHSGDCPAEVRDALAGGSVGYREVAAFRARRLAPEWLRPRLDSPSVAPPVTIFAREAVARRLEAAVGR